MRTPERIKYELENELACCAKCDYCYPTNGNPYGCEDRAYQIGIAEDALEYIQQLEATLPQWISVKERLPEDNVDVLVYAIGNDGMESRIALTFYTHRMYGYNVEGWVSPWQYFDLNYRITHWMPLPQPPKEGETC